MAAAEAGDQAALVGDMADAAHGALPNGVARFEARLACLELQPHVDDDALEEVARILATTDALRAGAADADAAATRKKRRKKKKKRKSQGGGDDDAEEEEEDDEPGAADEAGLDRDLAALDIDDPGSGGGPPPGEPRRAPSDNKRVF